MLETDRLSRMCHRPGPGSHCPWWSAARRGLSLASPAPVITAARLGTARRAWERSGISVRGAPKLWWGHWWHLGASFLLIQKPVHALLVAGLLGSVLFPQAITGGANRLCNGQILWKSDIQINFIWLSGGLVWVPLLFGGTSTCFLLFLLILLHNKQQ